MPPLFPGLLVSPSRKQRYQSRGTIFNAGTQKKTRETHKDRSKAPARLQALADKWKKLQKPSRFLEPIPENGDGGGVDDWNDFNPDDVFIASGRRNRNNRHNTELHWQQVRPHMVKAYLERKTETHYCQGNCILSEALMHLVPGPGGQWKTERMSFCTCSSNEKSAQLISRGFFPSRPINPTICFSLDLLEFFHNLFMEGPVSKRAFAVALVSFHQRRSFNSLPGLIPHFNNAYSHWIDIIDEAERIL